VNGGQCLIASQRVCQPVCYGGLGIKNLHLQDLALWVRWEWLRRTDESRPWQGLPAIKDQEARDVFDSLVKITVGNGAKTLFWRDRWLRGRRIEDHVPGLVAKVSTQRRNNRTIMQALTNHGWISDLRGTLSMPEIGQCLLLLSLVSTFFRDTSMPDSFSWPCSPTGEYTARATYQRLCMGPERWAGASCVWHSWAPLK
jgi:hypothetical protein